MGSHGSSDGFTWDPTGKTMRRIPIRWKTHPYCHCRQRMPHRTLLPFLALVGVHLVRVFPPAKACLLPLPPSNSTSFVQGDVVAREEYSHSPHHKISCCCLLMTGWCSSVASRYSLVVATTARHCCCCGTFVSPVTTAANVSSFNINLKPSHTKRP